MRERILAVMEKNSRIDIKDLAILLGESEVAVANEIAQMEKEHIICGYHTLINWDNTSDEKVVALIEVKVTPQRGDVYKRQVQMIQGSILFFVAAGTMFMNYRIVWKER